MLTVEQIREAYTKAVSEGNNIAELAENNSARMMNEIFMTASR